jgi:RNA polymerase sigma-70 factor (ECF subfamily)
MERTDDGDFTAALVALLPRLRRFAYALTRSAEEGDDLVQGTCERAIARRELWTPGSDLDRWLFRIARNLWIDRCRQRASRGPAIDPNDVPDAVGSDGRQVTEGRLTLAAVRRAILTLSEEQRLVLVLVCCDGLSYRETAERLELPIGTVMSRLARARQRLAQLMNDGEEGVTDAA